MNFRAVVSPCENGTILDEYACCCYAQNANAPSKCPIWQRFGASDASRWHAMGDFEDGKWDGGCKWFEPAARVDPLGNSNAAQPP